MWWRLLRSTQKPIGFNAFQILNREKFSYRCGPVLRARAANAPSQCSPEKKAERCESRQGKIPVLYCNENSAPTPAQLKNAGGTYCELLVVLLA